MQRNRHDEKGGLSVVSPSLLWRLVGIDML